MEEMVAELDFIKLRSSRAEELAPQDVLAEGPSLVPSTHIGQL